jgi:hypothetical protein
MLQSFLHMLDTDAAYCVRNCFQNVRSFNRLNAIANVITGGGGVVHVAPHVFQIKKVEGAFKRFAQLEIKRIDCHNTTSGKERKEIYGFSRSVTEELSATCFANLCISRRIF